MVTAVKTSNLTTLNSFDVHAKPKCTFLRLLNTNGVHNDYSAIQIFYVTAEYGDGRQGTDMKKGT
jgi:hypothetical protein